MIPGISEIEVGGVKRGFKFGTYALSVASELEKCSLTKIGERLKKGTLTTALHLLYGAAVSYCKSNKLPVDFEVSSVADWMDEVGLEAGFGIISKGLGTVKTDESKKVQAPNEGRDSLLKTA